MSLNLLFFISAKSFCSFVDGLSTNFKGRFLLFGGGGVEEESQEKSLHNCLHYQQTEVASQVPLLHSHVWHIMSCDMHVTSYTFNSSFTRHLPEEVCLNLLWLLAQGEVVEARSFSLVDLSAQFFSHSVCAFRMDLTPASGISTPAQIPSGLDPYSAKCMFTP